MAFATRIFCSSTIVFLFVVVCQIAFGQDGLNDVRSGPFREATGPVKLDELGDPLPPQARFQFGTERFVSRRPVFDMVLSPDGKNILTRDSESIQCWDATTGKVRWNAGMDSLWNASYGFRAFAFTENGEFFYSQSGPDKLLKWSVVTGKSTSVTVKNTLPLLPENRPASSFPGATLAIDVNKDGSRVAASGGHGVVIYDEAGNSVLEIPNKPNLPVTPADWNQDPMLFGGHYSSAIFSPDGKTLAVVTSDSPQRLRLIDASTGDERSVIELESRVVRMAFAPSGQSIATTERNNAVSQFSTATGDREWQYLSQPDLEWQKLLKRDDFATAVAYSPDGKRVAAAIPQFGRELICIFNAQSGALRSELAGHTQKPWSLAFTADSTTLYSAGLDRIIRRWDILKAQELPLEKGFHGTGIVATSPQHSRIAFGDSFGNIHIAEAAKLAGATKDEPNIKSPSSNLLALALSRDGKLLASASSATDELTVTIWNTSTHEVVHRWQLRTQSNPLGNPLAKIGSLEFSADGTRLAASASGCGRAYLLDATEGKQIAELEHDLICGMSFDRTGNQLVTAGANEKLCFWDTATGKLLSTKEMIGGDLQNVRCSPVDDLIVTAHFPNVLRIWNAKDMTLRKRSPLSGEANFDALAFSSDGNWIATASSGVVNIINPRTAEHVWQAGSHHGRVLAVGFAEQDKVLVSGGSDGIVYCWELRPNDEDGLPDFDEIWSALFKSTEEEIKTLQWNLVQMGDAAVDEVERRLKPITRIINLRAISKGVDRETGESRVRLAMQLCEKNPTVEVDIRLKRAIDFLSMLRNPKSLALLKQLAASHPSKDVRREAMFALETIQ